MDKRALRNVRRALRVERAIRYIERRRERDLQQGVIHAILEQGEEGLLEQIAAWRTLPESILLAVWRYRGRWLTSLEMAELLDAIQRCARIAGEGEFGRLTDGDPQRQAEVVIALTVHYILDELSFDGPAYTTFCGRVVVTPLSRDGSFADLRLSQRIEV